MWRYVLAADWIRLGEDLPLMSRTGQRDDELGSRVLAGRIVHTAMHLAFMLERRWTPYPKWLGTMLIRLSFADDLVPALTAVAAADQWRQRQEAVRAALVVLHRAQRATGLPTPETGVSEPFFDRPFLGIGGETVTLLLDEVTDPLVRRLPPGVGAVEQWVDNVRVLIDPAARVELVRHQFRAEEVAPRPVSDATP